MQAAERNGQPIEVAAICGSLRDGSYTRMALNVALEGAREAGARTRLIDLRDYHLAFCDGSKDEESLPEGVLRLRREVRASQGILLGTPEYHGSYSGVLKNALDLMGFDEFEGKMVGLVGVSAGVMGAFNGLNELRNVGRSLHAWVVPEQASVAHVWKVFDETGAITDPDLEERLKAVGRQVVRFACLHNFEKAPEFLRIWQGAPENPGGEG